MRRAFVALAITTVAFAAGVFLYSCGGDGDGGGDGAATGGVALYATDDLSGFQSVYAIINSVQVLHTGSGEFCTALEDEPIEVTELSGVLELLDLRQCPERSYNRLRLVLERDVALTDRLGDSATCSFDSYKNSMGQPNKLFCEGVLCTLDINGAVNVLSGQSGKLALDFMLKDFEVEGFPSPGCTVTMKVSPLNSSGMDEKKKAGYVEAVSGSISGRTDGTFLLSKGRRTFLVDYTGAGRGGVLQRDLGIEEALALAEADHLRVRVKAPEIGLDGPEPYPVAASEVYVIAEGEIGSLDTVGKTFSMSYGGKSITVDYSEALVEGTLSNGASADVKLYGYDAQADSYLAHMVDVP